jgi:hypothetical protein
MNKRKLFWSLVNWAFGIFVFIDGVLNLFRGNDFGFGLFLIALSLLFVPPTYNIIHQYLNKKFNVTIHSILKLSLGIFIIWATLAVGALAEGYYPEIW